MKNLVFACALLCSLGSVDIFGMEPNQQQENIADQNNQLGEIGIDIQQQTENVADQNDQVEEIGTDIQRQIVAGGEDYTQPNAATLFGLSAFFCGASLFLAIPASFGVHQDDVNPIDNFKRTTKTILAFIGVGLAIEAVLSHAPALRPGCFGSYVSTLLSLTIPAIGIVSIHHRKNSIISRSPVDSLELFLTEWMTYSFAALGGVGLFDSLYVLRRR